MTASSFISDEIVHRLRAQCPRIVVPSKRKNSFTFFRGSSQEKTVWLSAMISKTNPSWYLRDILTERRPWDMKIRPSWIHDGIENMIRSQATSSGVDITTTNLENIYKIVKRTRFLTWGAPIDSGKYILFLRAIHLSCVKRSVSDDVWRLACRNAGSVYGLNDQVLSDAMQEQSAYHTLYDIHPLLGRAWIPPMRKFVSVYTGDSPDANRYAEQFKSAMRAIGITRAGMRTLHRVAEKEPRALYTFFNHLISGGDDNGNESVRLLNEINGEKQAGSFGELCHVSLVYSGNLPRNPKDILVINQIEWWLKNDFRYRKDLIYDWMRWTSINRHGSLWRGFRDVTGQIKGSLQRKNAALAWADRSQRNWHLHFADEEGMNVGRSITTSNLTWKPLIDKPIIIEIEGSKPMMVHELASSIALAEEGSVMHHCVATYADICHDGQSHIFSIRTESGKRISTMELCMSKKKYHINQNRGPRNADISADCRKAAKKFLEMVNKNVIDGRGNLCHVGGL